VIARAGGMRRCISFLRQPKLTHDMILLNLTLLRLLMAFADTNEHKLTPMKLHKTLSSIAWSIMKDYECFEKTKHDHMPTTRIEQMKQSIAMTMVVLTDICMASSSSFDTSSCEDMLVHVLHTVHDMDQSTHSLLSLYLNTLKTPHPAGFLSIHKGVVHNTLLMLQPDDVISKCVSWLCGVVRSEEALETLCEYIVVYGTSDALGRCARACKREPSSLFLARKFS